MRRNLASSNWSRQVPWFAFVVHLRKREELEDWSASGFMRSHWGSDEGWQERVLTAPPFVISSLSFRASPVTGELILIPRLPEDVVFGEGRRLVARAVEIAVERGARVVGLGGLTAPATRGGASLIPALPEGVTLTTGNAFTAAVARHNVRDACRHLGRTRPVVAVLGATGSVGIAASRLLAEDEIELLLVGRSVPRLQRAIPELQERAVFSSELGDLRRADVVLVLTSDRSATLSAQHFDGSRRRVVVDLAQPANVEPHTVAQLRELQVSVVRGGWVHIPGATSAHDAQRVIAAEDPGAPPGSGPACLAETCMFAVEGIREHATGAASVDLAQRLERIAAKRGVRMLPLALDQVQPLVVAASAPRPEGELASQGSTA
jgi:fatty aldehyde-generating acyl-ACP reductase